MANKYKKMCRITSNLRSYSLPISIRSDNIKKWVKIGRNQNSPTLPIEVEIGGQAGFS